MNDFFYCLHHKLKNKRPEKTIFAAMFNVRTKLKTEKQ